VGHPLRAEESLFPRVFPIPLDSARVRFQVEKQVFSRGGEDPQTVFPLPGEDSVMPSPEEFLEETNVMSLSFLEGLYEDFLKDPESVPPSWREWFLQVAGKDALPAGARLGPSFRPPGLFDPPHPTCRSGGCAVWQIAALQERVDRLVHAWRVRGHLAARVDPLGLPSESPPELEPSFHGLGERDMDRRFSPGTVAGVEGALTLREILEILRETYGRSIGVQFMHIDDPFLRSWLQVRMEGSRNRLPLTKGQQVRILTNLTDAVVFEDFLQKKYVGAKRFSLEGAESLIPLLELALDKAASQGLREVVMAMAHRGRLNVLANVIGKSPGRIFQEFEDKEPELHLGSGDVKYHLGYTSRRTTLSGRKIDVSLCFNPSHLEFVDPVALGRMRAKQDRFGDTAGEKGMALLVHGDAAFIGEGVVQETLNLSGLPGYATGGALHVVVNNQIGFTTSPGEGRSTRYCTDIARMLQVPVFHVNGEDPEAVAQVVSLAMDFRKTFHRDAVIDMYCYRRYGHNEGDEPSFTHPALYAAIRKRKSVREGYLEHLLALGGVTRAEAEKIARRRKAHLEKELQEARSRRFAHRVDVPVPREGEPRGGPEEGIPEKETGVPREEISRLLLAMAAPPEGFHPHPKLERFLEKRRRMARGEVPLDWSAAEALAFATLSVEGHRVRLSGQDSVRGTFSHRHAVLYDQEDGRPWPTLSGLSPGQAPVEIYNSPLSENGVLGFEYGYSLEVPGGLVLWEAQFGDFANAAQVYMDQFLAAGEKKWGSLSGLVLLLPHGFEGQGPEHSSARIERFLELAAEDNLQVCQPSTPAQYFHLLRRQVLRGWRKPLVVFTPKSLLRHPRVVSPVEDFEKGRFTRVLPDPGGPSPEKVRRILLCSGKFFYHLQARREERGRRDTALLRVEQFYPLSGACLARALEPYRPGTPVFWVQEEPANMGALPYWKCRFGKDLLGRHPLDFVSRPPSASPATGFSSSHKLEQEVLLEQAFGDDRAV